MIKSQFETQAFILKPVNAHLRLDTLSTHQELATLLDDPLCTQRPPQVWSMLFLLPRTACVV